MADRLELVRELIIRRRKAPQATQSHQKGYER